MPEVETEIVQASYDEVDIRHKYEFPRLDFYTICVFALVCS